MSTKKSLEKCTIQGKEAYIGTFVAYPKSDYGYNGWYSSYRYNPNYKLIEKRKSLVHDWIWRECYKCLVV